MDTQKEQAKPSNLYDQLIDQYKLEAHISQTAVTDLYRAFDVDENRPVAIEILLPVFNNKKQYVEQFISKMNKVSQIKHPNIAEVHQIGLTPNDRPYIARDLVEGITLRERLSQLAEQPTPVNSIYGLKIVRQLAEALELAERLDIYHYHLSPDNIMLKQDGTVVLVDLGIPAAENGTAVKLTPHMDNAYMAPEQLQGKPVDSRGQIYALGVILHEILAGQRPAEPITFWQSMGRPFGPKNTILKETRSDLAAQTYALIEKSIRKEPWGRYANIKEFLEAINEALQNERLLIQTRGETAVSSPPTSSRSKAPLWVIALVLVLVLILGGTAVWAIRQNSTEAEPTSQPVAVDASATNTQAPTPTLAQTSNVAVPQEPSPTENAGVAGTITILAPSNATEFQAGETANFRWSWSSTLTENQRFSVYLLSENGRSLLGSVSTPSSDGNYSLQTLLPPTGSNAMAEWQIVLEDLATNREIATSSNRQIAIKPASTTPTFTPTATQTATPTFTASPTPIPQVEVSVSSASLRQGPGTVYPILRYLYQGDVVGVIGLDSPQGEWYNVILDDGTRGWLASVACRALDGNINGVVIAATIPPRPTNTPTPTPTNTPTPTFTPTPIPGGGNPQPTSSSPTNTPNPTAPPLPTP